MNIFTIFGEAFRALQQNRLRTGLTMLGMIIGVAAVVLMLSIGQGARTKINETIAAMGSKTGTVGRTSFGLSYRISPTATDVLADRRGRADRQRHRREVLDRIVRYLLKQRQHPCDAARDQEQRVTVGRCRQHLLGGVTQRRRRPPGAVRWTPGRTFPP